MYKAGGASPGTWMRGNRGLPPSVRDATRTRPSERFAIRSSCAVRGSLPPACSHRGEESQCSLAAAVSSSQAGAMQGEPGTGASPRMMRAAGTGVRQASLGPTKPNSHPGPSSRHASAAADVACCPHWTPLPRCSVDGRQLTLWQERPKHDQYIWIWVWWRCHTVVA
jgi:hypothetical protein